MTRPLLFIFGLAAGGTLLGAPPPLPNTAPLTLEGDLSAQMIAGIDRFLLREIDRAAAEREKRWQGDSVEPNRARFAEMIGLIDRRVADRDLEYVATFSQPPRIAMTDSLAVYLVRWAALEGVHGEGLLL